MPTVNKSVIIPRPPEEVFNYLADFANTEEWDPGVNQAVKSSSGPVGLGSTFDLIANFRGKSVPVRYEVTEYEPHTRVVLVGRNKNFIGTDTIGVAPSDGASRVFWNADFQMQGLAKLLQPFLGGVFEKLSQEAMDGLQATLGHPEQP